MNKEAIFSLIAGMAIRTCATSRYFKKKYELIAQEEIDSVKAALSRHMADNQRKMKINQNRSLSYSQKH